MFKNDARLRSSLCILTSAFLPCLFLNGCTQFGAVGGLVARAIPRHIDAAYKGMANQTAIVMVWLDRGLKMDYPNLQLDIGSSLQNKLIETINNEKPDDLKNTVFPVRESEVIRNQDDHPEWDNESITNTAAKFDGTRLIYLEIKDFATHSGAPELFRGTMKGDLKVIEMKDGKAKIAYAEEDISVIYPKDSPRDGLPIGTEPKTMQGTVDLFTSEVVKRFYAHDEDRD